MAKITLVVVEVTFKAAKINFVGAEITFIVAEIGGQDHLCSDRQPFFSR